MAACTRLIRKVQITGSAANSDLVVDGTTVVLNTANSYNGSTTISLVGKDPGGSGVKATYYTTDGTTPTTSSTQFTKPFTIPIDS